MAVSVRSRLPRGIPGKTNKGSWFDSSTATFNLEFLCAAQGADVNKMRVIIAGGREVKGDKADDLVRAAISQSGWTSEISGIIHGAASGIDSAAQRACEGVWPVTPVPADWDIHGKSAGPIRNRKMASMAGALIAVWDGKSRGTKNMIDTARRMGLRVYVHHYA